MFIDQLRGTVMVLMLLDHVRETFFLHHQVSDPMNVESTSPALFVSRLLAHLCAPVFVLLTGVSAFLYGPGASKFLLKRGVFLVLLELTVVNFAWTHEFPPSVLYLQVIWAIGLSMIVLAGLLWLPRWALAVFAVTVIAGHNLLDGIHSESVLWKVLHQRDWIHWAGGKARTSYPVLPWFGVIALGYVLGPWIENRRRMLVSGVIALASFFVLRLINVYGDQPRTDGLMSFFNVTKYPPSLLFVLLTVGVGLLLLNAPKFEPLAHIGTAPMFFYLLHLFVLQLVHLVVPRVETVAMVWLITAVLAVVLYFPTRAFGALKARRRDLPWLRYL